MHVTPRAASVGPGAAKSMLGLCHTDSISLQHEYQTNHTGFTKYTECNFSIIWKRGKCFHSWEMVIDSYCICRQRMLTVVSLVSLPLKNDII